MTTIRKTAAAVIALSFFSACSREAPNPILGKWVSKDRFSMMQLNREFTPTEMRDLDGRNPIPVTYEIKGDEVWVKPSDPSMAARCKVNGDTIHCFLMFGDAESVRLKK